MSDELPSTIAQAAGAENENNNQKKDEVDH